MADILVLGATGFTGKLITKYLDNHPDRASFSLALGARSRSKLDSLKSSLELHNNVKLIQVDVNHPDQVEDAVKQAKVIINTVGPFWRWGTEVVRACARHGVHYVDLTGETPWVRRIIDQFDYLATRTKATIVPACGLDSVPAELLVLLANKTIKDALGPEVGLGESLTVYKLGGGFSGGTVSSAFTMFEEVPTDELRASQQDFSLSPAIQGAPSPPFRLATPASKSMIPGFPFFMEGSNRAIVQRTWGLTALAAQSSAVAVEDVVEAKRRTYGPHFTYTEWIASPVHSRVLTTLIGAVFMGVLASFLLSPVRWLLKKVLPQPGEGPSEEVMQKGFITATNYTTAAAASGTPTHVKTVMRGRGDPGYSLTAVMISECALALLLNSQQLPPVGRAGGVLTPASAIGEVLVKRLEESGKIDFESAIVEIQ